MAKIFSVACFTLLLYAPGRAVGEGTRSTATYRRIRTNLDSVPAIDTHDHIRPFDRLRGYVETEHGRGMNLYGLLFDSYLSVYKPPLPAPWKPGGPFQEWWGRAKRDLLDFRALSQYRYQLSAFQDLYGIDFDRVTDEQAALLNQRIFENYRDPKWLYRVITERANIELMLVDPYWDPYEFKTHYPFEVLVFRVGHLIRGFHASEFAQPAQDPYHFARQRGLKVESLDDYLQLVERLFRLAKEGGAACLKMHNSRTLHFENVSKDRAARVFGRPRKELSEPEAKEFEDFMMWRLVELSAKYDLPFQIHTGQAKVDEAGLNPIRLTNLIRANPRTKFILFHGGFPWAGETAAVAMDSPNVWIDACWFPLISYSMAKRALHEWLEIVPSDRIMWGADTGHAEGVYAATDFTRRWVAEVLAEKVDAGDLHEEDALRIGRQILRENALKIFSLLKDRLWKHKGPLAPGKQ
jgi:predicted TIM-barrel fold metal-dependent hydrolase